MRPTRIRDIIMRKLFSFLICGALLVSFASCESSSKKKGDSSDDSVSSSVTTEFLIGTWDYIHYSYIEYEGDEEEIYTEEGSLDVSEMGEYITFNSDNTYTSSMMMDGEWSLEDANTIYMSTLGGYEVGISSTNTATIKRVSATSFQLICEMIDEDAEEIKNGIYDEQCIATLTFEKRSTEPDPEGPAIDPETSSHAYVDLGLTSGTLWATCNVGANSPEEYGDYFAWGETTTKEKYSWLAEGDYKWGVFNEKDATNYGMTKYNQTDGNPILETLDDAATANWGGNWRMPTKAEQDELRTECTWTWTTLNGINGYEVKGTNGNSIFLPAAGYRLNSSLGSAGSDGYYWSSSLYESYPYGAYALFFGSVNYDWGSSSRYLGLSVRPVCSSVQK